MSKELEAFYKIKDKLIKVEDNTTYGSIIDLANLDIIETALKDYENLKLKHRSMQDAVLKDFKKLKALEIIKEKGIDILEFRATRKAKTYNENTKRTYVKDYTDEEYNLLKEVLL